MGKIPETCNGGCINLLEKSVKKELSYMQFSFIEKSIVKESMNLIKENFFHYNFSPEFLQKAIIDNINYNLNTIKEYMPLYT